MNLSPLIHSHGNWLSMEQFMDVALFDKEGGYYSQNMSAIGIRGDFSTCATQSRLLARGLVAEWRRQCKIFGNLPFMEIGGGTAALMTDIARELSFWEKLRARYYMVERSDSLRAHQKMLGGGFVRSYETIEPALKAVNGRAFIFSNELPDAFPARQFVFQEGQWHELGLAHVDGRVQRQAWLRPLPKSTVFDRWAQEGQVVEVHESYHRWFSSWQPLWKEGAMITIDYGDVVDSLYYRRLHGSMRGYKAHQMLSVDDLPALAGHCDITCDVNFTDLRDLAESCVGDVVELETQHDFLAPLADPQSAADAHLIARPGAGDHFRVLRQLRFKS